MIRSTVDVAAVTIHNGFEWMQMFFSLRVLKEIGKRWTILKIVCVVGHSFDRKSTAVKLPIQNGVHKMIQQYTDGYDYDISAQTHG